MPILCVTPNPAIDRTLVVPNFSASGVFRPTEVVIAAGGKGINVARAIRLLGGQAICGGFVAGHMGRWLMDLAKSDGLEGIWTEVPGETRAATMIANPLIGKTAVLNEKGPLVAQSDWEQLGEDIMLASRNCNFVTISGSVPPGSTSDNLIHLVSMLHESKRQVWVDTSGEMLRTLSAINGLSIKVNEHEAGEIIGMKVTNLVSAKQVADELMARGLQNVVLTLGGNGAIWVNDTGAWHALPPPIEVVSTVGSGDSFFAGLILTLSRGQSPSEGLRIGVAAGAANAMVIGGARFPLETYQQILRETQVFSLA